MPDSGWKDIMRLMQLADIYRLLADDLEKHGKEWKKWYDHERPELETLPEGYTKLNSF